MSATTRTAASPSVSSGTSALLLLLKMRTFVALILVFAFFAINAPNFLTTANAVIISKHVALNAFLAIGMTFVIITGGIDLSVGSIVGLCGMVAGWLVLYGIDLNAIGIAYSIQFNTVEIALITVLVGMFVGLINGLLITKLNVAPFIATLGTLYVARGAALLASGGRTFPNLSGNPEYGSASFPFIGTGNLLGLPFMIWMLIAVAAIAAYVAGRTPLGRHIYAVGGNERGAALSGVKVNRVKLFVYVFSGFCAALVGLIIASQLQASHPATGETFELNAIAAAVLGGTSMSGGRGRIGGTIVGAFVIGILSDGLIMMGVSSFWQTVIKGLVIIAAVVIDQAQSRLQARVALQQEAAAAHVS
ncbi:MULTISPECIES: ABC transporter permease [Paracoccus]|uniref:ABC transporter permease n=1 Tax=Paracoccus litorisediminis TaxID=2006130 RepID=A0A844HK24_9RHOB|nr:MULTISPECIES: ABC transporter permease [Paracoccus]MBD9527374.1 ABC transporter permease [Paracoccus sp. PAR01]MTH60226.1 ABC transporter permease [Paracoccus litorisediminis]